MFHCIFIKIVFDTFLDEDECDELFTKLQNNWSIFKITKAAVSFVDLVASKCNKEVEFIQFLITALFSLPPEK